MMLFPNKQLDPIWEDFINEEFRACPHFKIIWIWLSQYVYYPALCGRGLSDFRE